MNIEKPSSNLLVGLQTVGRTYHAPPLWSERVAVYMTFGRSTLCSNRRSNAHVNICLVMRFVSNRRHTIKNFLKKKINTREYIAFLLCYKIHR
jgi:hypothetical protein